MLIALAALAGGHSFATAFIGRLACALRGFVFQVLIGFTNTTRAFAFFLGIGQFNVNRIARQVAVGSVILGAFFGGVDSLGISGSGQSNKEQEKE